MVDTLPSPPFVKIPNIINVRDIGGYEVPSLYRKARSVRRGLIYRGAELSDVTAEGRQTFKTLGITKVFDIRTRDELGIKDDTTFSLPQGGDDIAEKRKQEALKILSRPIIELEGIERVWLPVFGEKLKAHSQKEYEQFNKNTVERFVAKCAEVLENGRVFIPILEHLAKPSPTPIYIHCTGGKDRTGTVVMLLLRLVGVDSKIVAEEYTLTNEAFRLGKPKQIEELVKNPNLGLNEEALKNIVLAKEEYMASLCRILDERYGGAATYIAEHLGLGEDIVTGLKRNLIVDEAPVLGRRQSVRRALRDFVARNLFLLSGTLLCAGAAGYFLWTMDYLPFFRASVL